MLQGLSAPWTADPRLFFFFFPATLKRVGAKILHASSSWVSHFVLGAQNSSTAPNYWVKEQTQVWDPKHRHESSATDANKATLVLPSQEPGRPDPWQALNCRDHLACLVLQLKGTFESCGNETSHINHAFPLLNFKSLPLLLLPADSCQPSTCGVFL